MSAHLAIQTEIMGLLTASPAVAGGNVKANSTRPMPGQASSQVAVKLIGSRADFPRTLGAGYEWATSFSLVCMARAAGASSDAVAAVDPLLEAVWSRLSAWKPASGLGVIDVRMSPDIQWDCEDGDTPLVAATVSLVVQHRTQATSLAAWN